jgi:hypothetical protein
MGDGPSPRTCPLAPADAAAIRQLASDLPALWAAPTTTTQERKRLLRTLIADITLDSTRSDETTDIHIRWQTGATATLTAKRPTPGHPTDQPLLARVRTLAQTHRDDQIATLLNHEGLVSSWHIKDDPTYILGQPVTYWTLARVRNLRNKHQIPTAMPGLSKTGKPRADGLIPVRTAARQLRTSVSTLLEWFRQGLIPGHQLRPGTPVWIHLDDHNRHRYDASLVKTTPDLIPLADAPHHFGLTHPELIAALASHTLFAWRLGQGRSTRWFLSLFSSLSALPADLLSK